ncbi:F-box only protein 39-like isoform X1 [Pomacea canaliculata]|uniref:F-box only protein 39-like isoform X1 n=1 Tax=Pomacea canaliculata TaxID=400727 RepID=UPI000D72C368|nr:F-box only protein 39-like isoform X1 [Pomacea canaliculata]
MSARFPVRPTPAERLKDLPAVPWDALPQEALVNVFSYLCDGDRLEASLACKAWHRVFTMACLWRHRTFKFRGTKMQQGCYDGFLHEHGQHLEHMILEFAKPNTAVVQCFEAFVATANKCAALRLLSIKVRVLWFSLQRKGWSAYRTKIVQALCLLLKRQPMLQEADFFFCQFTHNEGLQVLKALTGDLPLMTRRNIISLSLREYFEVGTHYMSLRTFSEVMGRFPSLAFLHLDQHYLCEAVLDKLITGCAQTLRHLYIVMDNRNDHAIDSHTWSLAVQRCPSLTVTVRLDVCYLFEDYYSRVLVASMPLTRVFLWDTCGRRDITFADVARFLGYVSELFFNTIEEVCLKAEKFLKVDDEAERYRKMEKAVVKLNERCVQLKRLYFCIPLKPETLDKLSRVVVARLQNETKRLEVTVVHVKMSPGYIQERWPTLLSLSRDEFLYDDFKNF